MQNQSVNLGLEGIVVAETGISDVEGEAGRLSYRGRDIQELVKSSYLAVVHLLVLGRWPSEAEEQALLEFLIREGELNQRERALLENLPPNLHPMLMLQSLIPALATEADSAPEFMRVYPQLSEGFVIAAKMPSLIANWYNLQTRGSTVANPKQQNFHGNFLQQFTGRWPDALQVEVLDKVQMLQLEHSMNAGTFAGRVVASTQAPIQSAIAASIGALFGKLHGGADQAAVEMAQAIGAPEKAEAYVEQAFANKQKIMGMGHREYKVVDPRATILKPMARELCQSPEHRNLLATLEAVESACRKRFEARGKDIWANVEFYKGAVFQALGIPPHFFTAMFAMARVMGYIAHYIEFNQNPRLIRPQAEYRKQVASL